MRSWTWLKVNSLPSCGFILVQIVCGWHVVAGRRVNWKKTTIVIVFYGHHVGIVVWAVLVGAHLCHLGDNIILLLWCAVNRFFLKHFDQLYCQNGKAYADYDERRKTSTVVVELFAFLHPKESGLWKKTDWFEHIILW